MHTILCEIVQAQWRRCKLFGTARYLILHRLSGQRPSYVGFIGVSTIAVSEYHKKWRACSQATDTGLCESPPLLPHLKVKSLTQSEYLKAAEAAAVVECMFWVCATVCETSDRLDDLQSCDLHSNQFNSTGCVRNALQPSQKSNINNLLNVSE